MTHQHEIKNTKLHSGYSECDKYSQEGLYVEGGVTFPCTSAPLRTDHYFSVQYEEHHHGGDTRLSVFPIN